MRPRGVVVALLLLASCGDSPPPAVPEPDHEDRPRVLARVEALLPQIRAELGEEAIGDDPVAVLDPEDFRLRAARECSYAEKVFGPTTEEERASGFLLSLLISPHLVTDRGVLLLARVPEEDADLDARLIHGLVEGELARRFDLGAFRRAPANGEQACVQAFALAALVRHLGKKIADRAGVAPAYAAVCRIGTSSFEPNEVDCGMKFSIHVGTAGENYLRMAAGRYVDRRIERHGLDDAAARLFAHPPLTWGTLLDPDGRPVDTPGRALLETVRGALADELVIEPLSFPIVPPQIEALLFLADPAKRAEAATGSPTSRSGSRNGRSSWSPCSPTPTPGCDCARAAAARNSSTRARRSRGLRSNRSSVTRTPAYGRPPTPAWTNTGCPTPSATGA